MKIGYPCINRTIGCKGDRTFRLKSYSEERLIETVRNNLDCLRAILRFNVEHNILFFRITSDLVPFASHIVCHFDWVDYFKRDFASIGCYINAGDIRISMHPGQYTLLNSTNEDILKASIGELAYHAQVLDAMGLDKSAKIQIHVGGVYGAKEESIKRFVIRYNDLEERLKRRLVIENDDRQYTVRDCLRIHDKTKAPVVFDTLHHELNSSGETERGALEMLSPTWGLEDGIPMVDYSSARIGGRRASHAEAIDLEHFKNFIDKTRSLDCDIMLEIKDKETSALKAVGIAVGDSRFFTGKT